MKISFGSKIIEGPWGGGNLFLINLKEYLEANGHTIVFDLKDKDIDIILFTDPRKGRGSTSTFGEKEIKKYISKINKKTRVVQRINECDERKNTKGVNKLYLSSTEIADSVVFVSNWLQDIYLQLGLDENKSTVIMSGSNELIFNSYGRTEKPVNKKFKLLTHHWSSNYLKGFELYSLIDQLLETNKWRNKIEFTYLGNVDKEFAFKNTKIMAPLSGFELANEIKEHDIYVTGSLNEPSGNHHIEAALCGLPVLYINSGGVPEYAKNYGVEVTLKNFEERLEYLIEYYGQFEKKMKTYPYNSTAMCEKYEKLFNKVLNQ